VYFKRR